MLAPEHKPDKAHYGIYNMVLNDLKLPNDTSPQKALEAVMNKKAKLEADPAQSVWEMLKIYMQEAIVRAYCLWFDLLDITHYDLLEKQGKESKQGSKHKNTFNVEKNIKETIIQETKNLWRWIL